MALGDSWNRRRYGGYAVHLGAGHGHRHRHLVGPGDRPDGDSGGRRVGHDRRVHTSGTIGSVVEPLPNDARVIETRAELSRVTAWTQSGSLATAQRDYPELATPIGDARRPHVAGRGPMSCPPRRRPVDRLGHPAPRQPAGGVDLDRRRDRGARRRVRHLARAAAGVGPGRGAAGRARPDLGGGRLIRRPSDRSSSRSLVVPIGLLFLSGFGRDPSQIPSPLIGRRRLSGRWRPSTAAP